MSWIVEHDHRAEVLGYLGVLIIDGDAGIGAEDFRMTAGVEDQNEIGASRRKVAKVPSRMSSSRLQKSSDSR